MSILVDFIKYLNDLGIKSSTSLNKNSGEEYCIISVINKTVVNESFESNDIGIREISFNLNCYGDSLVEALSFSERVEAEVLTYQFEDNVISLSIYGGTELPLNSFNKYGWSFQVRILYYS